MCKLPSSPSVSVSMSPGCVGQRSPFVQFPFLSSDGNILNLCLTEDTGYREAAGDMT